VGIQVAFLRAINVGGRTVRMDTLREVFGATGFSNIATFIASGNVIFESRAADRAKLEARIAAALEKALGYEVATFVRTADEVAAVAAYRSFPARAIAEAAALNVGFVAEPLGAAAKRALASCASDIDAFHTHGREVYWLCAKKQSGSKFSNAVFERALRMRATFRGINTVRKLAAKHCGG
jgi:uncharacterized protein (DUF1697 family)